MLIKNLLTLSMLSGAIIALTGAMHSPSIAPNGPDAVAATLDAFHAAASKANFNAYLALFAPDGVFLGTDGTERWTVEEFKTYCRPYFDKGQGWTYTAIEGKRFITIADDGTVAWFDELLTNDKYGTCRGSGVLRRIGDDWRIAQYSLAFTIPNDVAKDVVALVNARQK